MRAKRGRQMMAPAQVSALDAIFGTADALPATQGDGVAFGDENRFERMTSYAMVARARAK